MMPAAILLLPALLAFIAGVIGPRAQRPLALALVLAAALPLVSFSARATEFQLLLRLSWIPALGSHFTLGTDGLSLLLALALSLAALAPALLQRESITRSRWLQLAIALVLVYSLDLWLWILLWGALLGLVIYNAHQSSVSLRSAPALQAPQGHGSTAALAAMALLSLALLVGVAALVHPHSSDSSNLITLANTSWEGLDLWGLNGRMVGGAIIETGFSLACLLMVLAAFAPWLGLFPLHRAMLGASAAPMIHIVPALALLGLLRIGYPLFPESVFLLRKILPWVALAQLAWMGLCAMGQFYMRGRDLGRMMDYLRLSAMGWLLLGFSTLTPVGFLGATLVMLHLVLAAPLQRGALAALTAQHGSLDLGRWGTEWKPYSEARHTLGLSMLAAAMMPGTVGFIGFALAVFGSFRAAPEASVAALVLWGWNALVLQRAWRRFEIPMEGEAHAPRLERHLPILVFLLLLVLGIWPSWLMHFLQETMVTLANLVAG